VRTSKHTDSFAVILHLPHSRIPSLSKPSYVGLGPSNAECGGLVCILSRGHVPYVVRPLLDGSEAFSLVVDAYVYGFMHGEINGEENSVRSIKLR
jgi:hypothetical protein